MKFNIPEIGTQIKLTREWEFVLYKERRNTSIAESLGKKQILLLPKANVGGIHNKRLIEWTRIMSLPKGSVLQVDRIYIRKDAENFSSVTFLLLETPDERFLNVKKKPIPFGKGKMICRFWAKLEDVNKIEFDKIFDATKSQYSKTLESKGKPFTFGEFKKELRKRKSHRFWVLFRKSGKTVHDGPVDSWTSPKKYSKYFVNYMGHYGNGRFAVPNISRDVSWPNDTVLENISIDNGYLTICKINKTEVDVRNTFSNHA